MVPGRTFRSLANRDFQWYAAASLTTNVAMWMQRIAQDWVAVKLEDGLAVGITTALQFLPMLLIGPFAGALADRWDRRTMLIINCGLMALPGWIFAGFMTAGLSSIWHLYASALMLGILSAIDAPVRSAYVRDIVPKKDLVNALGLSAVIFHSSRIIGPAIAGLLISAGGAGCVFFAVGAAYAASGAILYCVRQPGAFQKQVDKTRTRLGDTLNELRRQPGLVAVIALTGAVSTFALNFQVTLTLMATLVFKLPARGFGGLIAMMALGSISGAFVVARLAKTTYAVVLCAAGGLGLAYLAATIARTSLQFGLLLIPIGLLSNIFLASSNATVQMRTHPAHQGRMTGLYMAGTNVFVPVGAVLIGFSADHFTPRAGLAAAGCLCLTGSGLTLATLLGLRLIAFHDWRLQENVPSDSIDSLEANGEALVHIQGG